MRCGAAPLLDADHDVDPVENLDSKRLHIDPRDAQRGPVLKRMVVQIEQMLGQSDPMCIDRRQLRHPLRLFLGPSAGHRLQRGQSLFERLSGEVILLDVQRIGQHQVAAHVQLHPEQAGLGLGRGQRSRTAHLLGEVDVFGGVAPGNEGQCHDQQRDCGQCAETECELATDAERFETA